jgi:hypothetical protein
VSFTGFSVGGFAWWWVERSLDQPLERQSALRYGVLYGLFLVGVAGLLAPGGMIVAAALRFLLEGRMTLSSFLLEISEPLSAAIPFGILVAVLRRRLQEDDLSALSPRHIRLQRVYAYIAAGFGLAATFVGLQSLASLLLKIALSAPPVLADADQEQFAAAVATLVVGLPLWGFIWRALNRAAARQDQAGDSARRSMIRRGYLSLVLFVGIIGVVFTARDLISDILQLSFGEAAQGLPQAPLEAFKNLFLFSLLLAYHWVMMAADRRRTEGWLADRHSEFPVLVLAQDAGEYTRRVVTALQQEAPSMPVAVHLVDQGAPDELLSEAKAVILPAEVWARPPEAIRLWLLGYPGHRVVVPLPAEGWSWAFKGKQSLPALSREAARKVCQLAEGG